MIQILVTGVSSARLRLPVDVFISQSNLAPREAASPDSDWLTLKTLNTIPLCGTCCWYRFHINSANNVEKKFYFCAESSLSGEGETGNSIAFFSVVAPSATALFPTQAPLEDSDLMLRAVQESHLEEHIKPQLHNLLCNNVDVCTTKVGRTEILKHQIFLTNPWQKTYQVSPPKQKLMKEIIEDMLKHDIIEPSCSAWASPVVLIPKRES